MLDLTVEEIIDILDALRVKYGPGYSEVRGVRALQAKLSIALEVKSRKERL